MSTPITQIEPERRVEWCFHRITYRGAVARATASTVWVKPDQGGDLVTFRKDSRGLVALDVLTPHQLALEAWIKARPRTKCVDVSAGLGGDLEGGQLYVYVHTEALRKATTEEALALMTREAQRLTTWLAARPREGHAPPAPTAPPTTADGDISDADLDAFIEAATGFPVSQDPRHAEPVAEQRRRFREAFKTHARRPR